MRVLLLLLALFFLPHVNAQTFSCADAGSCDNVTFLADSNSDVYLDCSGAAACQNTVIDARNMAPPFKAVFDCKADDACSGISIITHQAQVLDVELYCESRNACSDINLQPTGGSLTIIAARDAAQNLVIEMGDQTRLGNNTTHAPDDPDSSHSHQTITLEATQRGAFQNARIRGRYEQLIETVYVNADEPSFGAAYQGDPYFFAKVESGPGSAIQLICNQSDSCQMSMKLGLMDLDATPYDCSGQGCNNLLVTLDQDSDDDTWLDSEETAWGLSDRPI